MRGKRLLVAGTALFAAVAAIAVWRFNRPPAPAPKAAPAPLPPPEVSLAGKIRAQNVVSIAPEVAGVIQSFLVEVGQEVYEGQLLARLSSEGLETGQELARRAAETAQTRVNKLESAIIAARLEASRARADALRARDEFERAAKVQQRQRLLHSQGATPRRTYEKSEQDLQTAQAENDSLEKLARHADEQVGSLLKELETARKILDDKNRQLEDAQAELKAGEIVAPASGLIVARAGEPGAEIEAGAELFQLATDLTVLAVELEPDPPTLGRLSPGLPALVFVPEIQDEGLPGSVQAVEEGRAVVEFANPNPAIRPGTLAQVRIQFSRE